MIGIKYEVGAVVKLNDRRGTVAKVVDVFVDSNPPLYILETVDDQRRYEMYETDIKGLA